MFTKSRVDWWKYRGAEALCGIAVRVFDPYSVFTGVIVTARRFDRERQREYSITVTATDWAEEPLIGICQLTIQILDQNDNSPKFENLRYECKFGINVILVDVQMKYALIKQGHNQDPLKMQK